MTARACIAPLAARLRTALADEKQRVNLLAFMGLAGLASILATCTPAAWALSLPRAPQPPTTPPSWKAA